MTEPAQTYDVVIIGAGPAGSLAASLLTQAQHRVLVVEKQHFPRFSIGESLLPQSMVYLEEAGLLQSVLDSAHELGFQYKNGAVFVSNQQQSVFDFADKSCDGPESTYQVKRASFDQLLAQKAQAFGAEFIFGSQLESIDFNPKPELIIRDEEGMASTIKADFVLDASGFGRVLPRLLDLDLPSEFPVRSSIFCHIQDNITDPTFDRNKILIETHPNEEDVWYWLIPFSDNTASLGCVAKPEFFERLRQGTAPDLEPLGNDQLLLRAVNQSTRLSKLLFAAVITQDAQQLTGYASNVKQLYGDHYALLGNAGEFLDPIFSSGVTIAFKSATLACDCLIKQFNQQAVCWNKDFAEPLRQGVNTFKAFVDSWYQQQLQDIIQFQDAPDNIRQMICSVLAGYAWDDNNPFVVEPKRRLNVLGELCAP
ncbi:NAD(P)/FAD-dependent oxidoreductase [Kangiella marina]|uniref:NAD(P)/FAD-dependent oxidoreductase n=1 Tax=Kangiella marina TaxID=1079178 RepID=A0ABP8IKG0_9GAMM